MRILTAGKQLLMDSDSIFKVEVDSYPYDGKNKFYVRAEFYTGKSLQMSESFDSRKEAVVKVEHFLEALDRYDINQDKTSYKF